MHSKMALMGLVLLSIGAIGVAGAPASSLQTLMLMDCKSNMHFAPNTPMAQMFAFDAAPKIMEGLMGVIKSRVSCKCPNMDADAIMRARYDPVGAMINLMDPASTKRNGSIPCLDHMNPQGQVMMDMMRMMMEAEGGMELDSLPSTCNAKTWNDNKYCRMKMRMKRSMTELQFMVQKCPSNENMNFMSLSCAGPMCKSMTPCKTNAFCGSGMKCEDVTTASSAPQMGQMIFEMMKGMELVPKNEVFRAGSANDPTPQFRTLIREAAELFPAAEAGAGIDGQLGMCMPVNEANMKLDQEEMDNFCKVPGNCIDKMHMNRCGKQIKKKWMKRADWMEDWDGKLENGAMANSNDRMMGDSAELGMFAMKEGMEYMAGIGCGGDIRFMPDSLMGFSYSMPWIHKTLNALVKSVATYWQTRGGRTMDQFLVSFGLWRPEPYLCAGFSRSDGNFRACENMVPNTIMSDMANAASKHFGIQSASLPSPVAQLWEKAMGAVETVGQSITSLAKEAELSVVATHFSSSFKEVVEAVQGMEPVTLKFDLSVESQKRAAEVASSDMKAMEESMPDMATMMAAGESIKGGNKRIRAPATCNYDVWRTEGQCSFESRTGGPWPANAQSKVQIQNCLAVPYALPAMHLSCKGEECRNLKMKNHCSGVACPSGTKCMSGNLPGGDMLGSMLFQKHAMPTQHNANTHAKCMEPAKLGHNNMPFGQCQGPAYTRKEMNIMFDALWGSKLASSNYQGAYGVCMPHAPPVRTGPKPPGVVTGSDGIRSFSNVVAVPAGERTDPTSVIDFTTRTPLVGARQKAMHMALSESLHIHENNVFIRPVSKSAESKFAVQSDYNQYEAVVNGLPDNHLVAALAKSELNKPSVRAQTDINSIGNVRAPGEARPDVDDDGDIENDDGDSNTGLVVAVIAVILLVLVGAVVLMMMMKKGKKETYHPKEVPYYTEASVNTGYGSAYGETSYAAPTTVPVETSTYGYGYDESAVHDPTYDAYTYPETYQETY